MKKIAAILLTFIMLLSALAISAFAEGICLTDCNIDIDLKKTDPSRVIKNGKIDPGEYEEYLWTGDLETGECNLTMQWANGGRGGEFWDKCVAMGNSSHWYFSWDEVHGFNFAVVVTIPEEDFCTNWPQSSMNENGFVEDAFMGNVGLNIWNSTKIFNKKFDGALYYSIARDITTGTYLEGHIGTLGNKNSYDPVGGTDFFIGYEGTTATFEWSIPFDEFVIENYQGVGTEFPFNITVTAGNSHPDTDSWYPERSYGIQFGQNAWLLHQLNKQRDAAWFTIVDEYVAGGETPVTTPSADTVPVTTKAPETTVITEIVFETTINEAGEVEKVTDADGSAVTAIVTRVETVEAPATTPGQGTAAPATGDPMIMAAVLAAITACGAVVSKKRK